MIKETLDQEYLQECHTWCCDKQTHQMPDEPFWNGPDAAPRGNLDPCESCGKAPLVLTDDLGGSKQFIEEHRISLLQSLLTVNESNASALDHLLKTLDDAGVECLLIDIANMECALREFRTLAEKLWGPYPYQKQDIEFEVDEAVKQCAAIAGRWADMQGFIFPQYHELKRGQTLAARIKEQILELRPPSRVKGHQ